MSDVKYYRVEIAVVFAAENKKFTKHHVDIVKNSVQNKIKELNPSLLKKVANEVFIDENTN